MGQPQALRDCGRGYGRRGYRDDDGYGRRGYRDDDGDYDRPRRSLCANWREACADLYGPQTQQWYQCMNQPKARRDCS